MSTSDLETMYCNIVSCILIEADIIITTILNKCVNLITRRIHSNNYGIILKYRENRDEISKLILCISLSNCIITPITEFKLFVFLYSYSIISINNICMKIYKLYLDIHNNNEPNVINSIVSIIQDCLEDYYKIVLFYKILRTPFNIIDVYLIFLATRLQSDSIITHFDFIVKCIYDSRFINRYILKHLVKYKFNNICEKIISQFPKCLLLVMYYSVYYNNCYMLYALQHKFSFTYINLEHTGINNIQPIDNIYNCDSNEDATTHMKIENIILKNIIKPIYKIGIILYSKEINKQISKYNYTYIQNLLIQINSNNECLICRECNNILIKTNCRHYCCMDCFIKISNRTECFICREQINNIDIFSDKHFINNYKCF